MYIGGLIEMRKPNPGMSSKELPDEELLLQVANGNDLAFANLYHRYQKKIFTFCAYILQSDTLAEEVVQEVMLKLWTMGNKATEINNLDAWLRQVSRNRSIDLLRQQQSDKMREASLLQMNVESVSVNFTEEMVLMRDAREMLENGIAQLPEQQRKVYIYMEKEGLEVEEVASLMNIQVSTTHTHLKLARKALKIYLSKYFDLVIVGLLLKFF